MENGVIVDLRMHREREREVGCNQLRILIYVVPSQKHEKDDTNLSKNIMPRDQK